MVGGIKKHSLTMHDDDTITLRKLEILSEITVQTLPIGLQFLGPRVPPLTGEKKKLAVKYTKMVIKYYGPKSLGLYKLIKTLNDEEINPILKLAHVAKFFISFLVAYKKCIEENSSDQNKSNSKDQGKPNSGNQGKPNSGNQGKPNSGNQGKPNSGNQGKPNSGNQGKPNSGYQSKPNSGNREKSTEGNKSSSAPDCDIKEMKKLEDILKLFLSELTWIDCLLFAANIFLAVGTAGTGTAVQALAMKLFLKP